VAENLPRRAVISALRRRGKNEISGRVTRRGRYSGAYCDRIRKTFDVRIPSTYSKIVGRRTNGTRMAVTRDVRVKSARYVKRRVFNAPTTAVASRVKNIIAFAGCLLRVHGDGNETKKRARHVGGTLSIAFACPVNLNTVIYIYVCVVHTIRSRVCFSGKSELLFIPVRFVQNAVCFGSRFPRY